MENDWPWLGKYREANTALPAPAAKEKRVVFMGDSITEGWGEKDPDFFKGRPYINRGISGPTTPDDGVHPNLAGYKVMEPLVEKAITQALEEK